MRVYEDGKQRAQLRIKSTYFRNQSSVRKRRKPKYVSDESQGVSAEKNTNVYKF